MTKEGKRYRGQKIKLNKVDDKTAYENLLVKYAELEQENNKLLDVINNQDVKIADLEKQIEKMKEEHKQSEIGLVISNSSARAELEKENAILKGRTEAFEKQILGLLYKYESVYKRFPDLKDAMDEAERVLKENAELKEKLNIRSCQNCKHNNKSCPNDGSCKNYSKWEGYENSQLTKATEIIKDLCGMVRELNKPNVQLTNVDYSLAEAEQFLKEIEK